MNLYAIIQDNVIVAKSLTYHESQVRLSKLRRLFPDSVFEDVLSMPQMVVGELYRDVEPVTALYDVAGETYQVVVLRSNSGRYGTRHRVALVNDETIDGLDYKAGDVFDGDIYSASDYYTVSLTINKA